MRYQIVWEFDSDAETPEAAAREALAIQRRPDSTATVFDVTDTTTGITHKIDLMFCDPPEPALLATEDREDREAQRALCFLEQART